MENYQNDHQEILKLFEKYEGTNETLACLAKTYRFAIRAFDGSQSAIDDIYQECPCGICKHAQDVGTQNAERATIHRSEFGLKRPPQSWQYVKEE